MFFHQFSPDMWWTNAENFKLISLSALDLLQFNWKILAIAGLRWGDNGIRRPLSPQRRPTIAKIFQLNSHKSKTHKDISLKFSAFVYHMSGLNWQKNFDHCSICVSVAPSSRQKLWAPLATIFVEKKFWKKFWWGFRHIWVTPWKEFSISWKRWRFEIFRTALPSRASVVHA